MNARIYPDAMKILAEQELGHGRLIAPHGEILMHNPLCGDRVEMEVKTDKGRIAAVAHRVKGCLLCRASASIIGANAVGAYSEEIERITMEVERLLEYGEPLATGWDQLQVFSPVHGHRSRYRCVLLPLRALIAALRIAA